jgi:hypothetical protein
MDVRRPHLERVDDDLIDQFDEGRIGFDHRRLRRPSFASTCSRVKSSMTPFEASFSPQSLLSAP